MEISTQFNIGKQGQGFGVVASATVNDADRDALASLGLKYMLQRVSEVDHILGGFDAKGERIKGWKRGDCNYSAAKANELSQVFRTLHFPDSTKTAPHTLNGVTTAIALAEGEAKEPVFAREKKKFAQWESLPEGLEAKLKAFAGFEGDTHGEDGEYSPAALAAAKVAIDKALAAF